MGDEAYEPLLGEGGKGFIEEPSLFKRYKKYFIIGAIACVAIIVTIAIVASVGNNHSRSKRGSSKDNVRAKTAFGEFRFGAIADDSGVCGQIGTTLMAARGASVVDAAIASLMCTGVANIHSCGLGGSVMMTIYDTPRNGTRKEMTTIVARDRAPLKATQDMFDDALSIRGGLAVAVPGYVKGLHEAWTRFGRVSWSELIEPTIQMCEEGYIVNHALEFAIAFFEDLIRADANFRQQFVKPDGDIYREGDTIKCTKLARTLRIIAGDPLSFYDPESQLAKDIVADLKEYGSIITTEDLANYKAQVAPPLNTTLQNGGYHVFTSPPPTGGATFSEILNILDGYNFDASDVSSMDAKKLTYHRIIEAYKFAYAEGSGRADPAFVNMDELVSRMTSKTFAESRRLMINDKHTLPLEQYGAKFAQNKDGGTVHLSLLAPDGSAVAISATINLYFGAKVLGSRTGIIFNNNMDDFAKPGKSNYYGMAPSPVNLIEPGKMPVSSVCPHLFLDKSGNVRYVGGASGGTAIPSATSFVAMNTLWFKKRLDESTGLFRFHHQLMPNEVCLEQNYETKSAESKEIIASLKKKGHKTAECGFAIVQAIHNTCDQDADIGELDTPCIHAASDGRKTGRPVGL